MLKFILLLSFIFSFTFANKDLQKFDIQYLVDESSNKNIEEIANSSFDKSAKSNFNLGYKKGSLWFKFTFENNSKNMDYILSLNEVFYEVANLYYYDDDWIKKSNSIFTLIKDREVKSNHLAFKINIPQNEKRTFYLELKAKYAYFGNLSLYEYSSFHLKNSFGTNILYVFVLGVVLALIFFTLFLYVKTKEIIYFYYLSYCFFNFIYFANIGGLLVYVDLQKYIYELQLAPAFMIGFLTLFSNEYLETKKYLKSFDKVLKAASAPFFILGFLVLFSYQPWNKFINNFSGLMGVFLIVLSIVIYFRGNHKTKFYTFAMLIYFIFIFMFAFMVNGTLEYTDLTRYAVVVINAVEMMIFSYILTSRYHTMNEKTQQYLELEVDSRTKKLNVLLKERELLLKEIYHRVKNNFHMLIGILHLEDSKQSTKAKHFTDIINRIKSMSVIHEQLYKSNNISDINIQNYLLKIISNLKTSYPKVKINTQIQQISLSFDNAVSVGLVLNEVVTNAIKHNSNINDLNVDIKLTKKDNTVLLSIKDNGLGFKKDKKGLGLKLVDQFSKKLLDSKYEFLFENGTKFELQFNGGKTDE